MALIESRVFVDTDVFGAIREQINKAPALGRSALKVATNRARARIRTRLEPPGPPALPFVWSLDPAADSRARRWYFANKVPKGSRGGRYKRTGALIEGIELTTIQNEGTDLVEISSDAPGAPYVIGNRQVPGHEQWFTLDDIALDESERITDELIELWFTLADPTAGISP